MVKVTYTDASVDIEAGYKAVGVNEDHVRKTLEMKF